MPGPDLSIDLDQVFTSAGYAMLFAIRHWDHFAADTSAMIGRPIPLSEEQFTRHGERIAGMIEPFRGDH